MTKFKIIVAAIIAALIGLSAGNAMSTEPPIPPMPNTLITNSPDHVTFYLEGPIDEQSLSQLIKFYTDTKSAKTLDLIINSVGGYLDPSIKLIDLMLSNTNIKTSCKVEKLAASAAATILMACDKIEIGSDALILYHLPHIGKQDDIYLRRPEVVEKFVNYANETFCFDNALGDNIYKKFIYGYDVVYHKGEAIQSVINKSCRLRNGEYKIGHG